MSHQKEYEKRVIDQMMKTGVKREDAEDIIRSAYLSKLEEIMMDYEEKEIKENAKRNNRFWSENLKRFVSVPID